MSVERKLSKTLYYSPWFLARISRSEILILISLVEKTDKMSVTKKEFNIGSHAAICTKQKVVITHWDKILLTSEE